GDHGDPVLALHVWLLHRSNRLTLALSKFRTLSMAFSPAARIPMRVLCQAFEPPARFRLSLRIEGGGQHEG
ncbi:MAG: hypothetical protein RR784_02200, partial [Burkholderiaceae bacterium]